MVTNPTAVAAETENPPTSSPDSVGGTEGECRLVGVRVRSSCHAHGATTLQRCLPLLQRGERACRSASDLMAARALWASRAASYLRISTFHRSFSSVLNELKYSDSHEWVKVDGTSATVGITDHAQDHLGDVVYVELPEVGAEVTKGNSFGSVESVKATSDVYSPVSGKVVEVNEKLGESPGLVNGSPYDNGWIIKVEMTEKTELNSLMDSAHYTKFCEEEDAKH